MRIDDLHLLPKVRDSGSFLYLQRGRLEQDDRSVSFVNELGITPIPIANLSLLLLGPGTTLTVIAVERVSAGLRGDLSRWLLQPQSGVFVGSVSAMVRERLWARVCEHRGAGACLMVVGRPNEQGFELRQHGDRARQLVDIDGFALVTRPAPEGT